MSEQRLSEALHQGASDIERAVRAKELPKEDGKLAAALRAFGASAFALEQRIAEFERRMGEARKMLLDCEHRPGAMVCALCFSDVTELLAPPAPSSPTPPPAPRTEKGAMEKAIKLFEDHMTSLQILTAPTPAKITGLLKDARAEVEGLKKERDGWEETAAQFHRGQRYYRGLVVQCGEALGKDAKTADDGGVGPDVLCAKVPELVVTLAKERDAAVSARREAEAREAKLKEALEHVLYRAEEWGFNRAPLEHTDFASALMEARAALAPAGGGT